MCFVVENLIYTLGLGEAYIRHCTGFLMVQVIACPSVGTNTTIEDPNILFQHANEYEYRKHPA